MRRTLAKEITSVGNRVVSDTGDFAQDVFKNTRKLVRDLSRSLAKVDFNGMYNDASKSLRFALRRGNRNLVRSMKRFRKTQLYNTLSDVPVYLTQIRKWSGVQFDRIARFTTIYYKQSRKWVVKTYPKVEKWVGNTSSDFQVWFKKQYPKVRDFVEDNFPRVENLFLSQVPAYRAIFSRR